MQIFRFKLSTAGWLIISSFYCGLFLVILWLAYHGQLPKQLDRIPFYDKIGHVVLYALASFVGHRMFNRRWLVLMNWSLPAWPALFGLFTLVEEGLQALSPNRTFSILDLVCSLVGVGLGFWLAERGKNKSALKKSAIK